GVIGVVRTSVSEVAVTGQGPVGAVGPALRPTRLSQPGATPQGVNRERGRSPERVGLSDQTAQVVVRERPRLVQWIGRLLSQAERVVPIDGDVVARILDLL